MKTIDEINKKTLLQTKKVLDELTKNYEEFSIGYYKHKEKYKNSPVVVIEQEILEELVEQNTKLKELLKKCLEVLEMVQGETIYFPRTVDDCIDKINQVLGEEK